MMRVSVFRSAVFTLIASMIIFLVVQPYDPSKTENWEIPVIYGVILFFTVLITWTIFVLPYALLAEKVPWLERSIVTMTIGGSLGYLIGIAIPYLNLSGFSGVDVNTLRWITIGTGIIGGFVAVNPVRLGTNHGGGADSSGDSGWVSYGGYGDIGSSGDCGGGGDGGGSD